MSLRIERVDNGYQLIDDDDEEHTRKQVIQEDEEDELCAIEELLWQIIEWAGMVGSKHDKERIRIIRKAGDDHGD